MRTLVLASVLLTGCAILGPDASNTPEGRCEAAAYDDPAVKEIMVLRNSGNATAQIELLPDQRDAVQRAKMRCMQSQGLAPPGGVEPVRREH